MVLAPERPLPQWFTELDGLIQSSPGFFAGRPVILDASKLPLDNGAFREMIELLGDRGIRVLGIEGALPDALTPDLPPVVTGGRQSGVVDAEVEPPPAGKNGSDATDAATDGVKPARDAEPEYLLIDRPIRSGQSVFYRGDVTVVGSVASGAEIVAGGSIHVYGALRGRALAGSTGNGGARIFCSKMEAELVAINGLYQTAENMAQRLRGRPVQAWLEGDVINMTELN
jgi:septum site-determining protein MinC